MVLVGDHTKAPKDGRKMPAVTILHQDSETSGTPSFFRGHHWGCIAVVVQACDKFFATPLWASIQEGLAKLAVDEDAKQPKTTRIVQMAQKVAYAMGHRAYLVLEAYFAVGPVFENTAAGRCGAEPLIHILTRAKKNVVAYGPARARKKSKRGRPKKYGKQLKLMKLFDSKAKAFKFQTAEAVVYQKREPIRSLVLDLLWKPTKGMLRFILVESARGRMILISSDLKLDALTAVDLYSRRVTIETMFDTLKNTLGGMAYHFWSQYLNPASRRPRKKARHEPCSSHPLQPRNTRDAIEKFVNVLLLVWGTLQLIAKVYPEQVRRKAHCWLRTMSTYTPSEFVTRTALSNIIRSNLYGFGKDWITQLIRRTQKHTKNKGIRNRAA